MLDFPFLQDNTYIRLGLSTPCAAHNNLADRHLERFVERDDHCETELIAPSDMSPQSHITRPLQAPQLNFPSLCYRSVGTAPKHLRAAEQGSNTCNALNPDDTMQSSSTSGS